MSSVYVFTPKRVSPISHVLLTVQKTHRRDSCPFRKRSMPFSRHKFFNTQQILLYLIKEKGKYASNHPVSNPKPLFPNIPLIPLHYQVDVILMIELSQPTNKS